MANEEYLAILKQGVKVWNEWRKKDANTTGSFYESNLSETELNEAELRRAKLRGVYFVRVDLSGANLRGAVLSDADLRGADLSGANLRGAVLSDADLRGADLRNADLRNADLSDANLSEANLRNAKLRNADLRWAGLPDAVLSGAILSDADLSGAILNRADLYQADLHDTDLSEAELRETNLSQADLGGAILRWADFRWADFSDTDLSRTIMAYTTLGNIDLRSVRGLETVRHDGPSLIGIDTIYRSQGKIPEVFLRGAGVPDSFITYMHSLTSEAIQYYTCFISYSTKDQDFATRLHADLQAKGVRCWFAPEDIAGGKKVHEQIDQAIRLYDKLLVVLSKNSMESEWVKTEIYHARQQELEESRRKLFPISLVGFDMIQQWKAFDADTGKDMAREVREYFIPDFSHWKDHDAYQSTFNRLLRDLKAEAAS